MPNRLLKYRPLINSVPLRDYTQADKVLKRLDAFDWIVFTSANGVEFFFQRLNIIGLDTRAIGTVKVTAIGKATAEKLKTFGILVDMQPKLESSAEPLKEFQKAGVKGKRVLLVRLEVGSSMLLDGLADADATIETVVVYRNVDIEPEETDFGFIDQIPFTSSSAVRAFLKRYGSVPAGIKVYCFVKGRLKPATMGTFKTSHFEEHKVCHKYSPIPTMTGFKKNHYGKSTQNGYGKRDIDIERAWQSFCCENLRLLRPKGLLMN